MNPSSRCAAPPEAVAYSGLGMHVGSDQSESTIKLHYSAGRTAKSNSRLAPADPAPYAPIPDELRKQYSPGFSGVFGTTLYTPGLNFVKSNAIVAFSSVPEDAPNALACITTVSRESF